MAAQLSLLGDSLTAELSRAPQRFTDRWDSSGQVYFAGGRGYAVAPDGHNFVLGNEAVITEALKVKRVPFGASALQISEYLRIFEILKGEQDDRPIARLNSIPKRRAQKIRRGGNQRVRPSRPAWRKR